MIVRLQCNRTLRRWLSRLRNPNAIRAAPYLDLLPIKMMYFVSAAGKSYHFGGSFSHAKAVQGDFLNTDRVGRLKQWKHIHMVDGSVFPSVPATTFTLTVMANAHRIAEESVVLRDG